MRIAKCSVFVFTLLCFFLLPICTTGRLCCDPQCRKPISYARTNTRNVKREPGHVLYSAGTVTTVLSKAAGMENEVELWEVEILGSKGLILSSALNEISVLCETQNLLNVPDASSQVEQASKTLQQPITQDDGEHFTQRKVETFIPQSTTDTVGTSGDTVHPSPEVPIPVDTPKPEENLGTQVYQQEGDLNGKNVVHDDDIRYSGGQTHNGGVLPNERGVPNKESSPSIDTPNGRNIPPNGASPFPTASLLDQLHGDGGPVVDKPGPPPPKVPEHVQKWREQQQQQLHQQQQQVAPPPGEESREGETQPVGTDGFGDVPRTGSAADVHGHDHESEMKETDGVLEPSPEERVDQQKFEQADEDIRQDHGSQFHGDWPGEEPGFQEELEPRMPEEDKPHQNEVYTADPDQGSKTIIEEQPPPPPPTPPPFIPVPSQTTPIAWGTPTEELMESRDLNIKPSPLELILEEKEEDDNKITLRFGKKAKVSVREDRRIDVLLDDGTQFDVTLDYFDDLEEDILDFIDERLLYDYDIDLDLLEDEDEELANQDEESEIWDEESDHWNAYQSEEPEDKNDKMPDPVSPDSIPSTPDSFPEHAHEHQPEPEPSLHSPAQPSDGSGHYTAKKYLNLDAIRERAEKSRQRDQGRTIDEDPMHDSGLKDTTRPETIFSTTMIQFDSLSSTPDGHPTVAPDEGLPGSAGEEAATAQDVLPTTASEPTGNFEGSTSGTFQEQDLDNNAPEVPHKPEATAPPVEPWVDQTPPPPESIYDDTTPPSIEEEEVDSLPYEKETPPTPRVDQTVPPPPITRDETPPPLFEEQEAEEFDGLPFGGPFGEPPHTPGTEDVEKTGFMGILASFLPTPLADWLMAQGPETGLVAVVATSLAVLIPICCSYCSARKDSRKKTRMLREQKTSRYQLEEQLKKLREEHASLADRVREIEGKHREVEMELRGEHETKAELEAHNQSLAASLATIQEETAQYQSHMEQLNTQLVQGQSQLTVQLQEREISLQQLSHLTTQLEEAGQRASEGEAARDQLEREVFSVRDRLQELEGRHLQVTKAHEESEERRSQLESQIARTQDELATVRATLREREEERNTLAEVLQEVTHGMAEAEDTEGAETESSGQRSSGAQLARIQAMLDTTRVQRELNAMTGERDQLAEQHRGYVNQMEQLQAELASLRAQVHSLTEEKERVQKLQEETESRLKTLTEFFERQTQTLHRQRFQEEATRQSVETREARAVEQATGFEQERLREREELKELRKQMAEIEKSLMQQVATNEKRAEEAQAQLRRTEQDLRQANREVTILKRSLAESMDARARALVRPEQRPGPGGPRLRPRSPPPLGRSVGGYGPPYPRPRPPSTGPPGTRLPPRPLSTTRLPRTSSPGSEGREPGEQQKGPMIGSSASQPILNTAQPPPAPPQGDNRQLPLSQSFDIPRRPVDETGHHAVTKEVDSSGPGSSESQFGSQRPLDGTKAQPRSQPPQDGSRLQQRFQPPLDGSRLQSRSQRPMDGSRSPRPYHPTYGVPPPGHMPPPYPLVGVPPPPRPRDYRPPGRGFPPMDRRHPPPPGPGPVPWDRRRPPMGPSPSGEYLPPELRGNVAAGPPPMVPSGAAGSIHRPIPQNPSQEPQQRTLLSHPMTGFSHVPQQPTSQYVPPKRPPLLPTPRMPLLPTPHITHGPPPHMPLLPTPYTTHGPPPHMPLLPTPHTTHGLPPHRPLLPTPQTPFYPLPYMPPEPLYSHNPVQYLSTPSQPCMPQPTNTTGNSAATHPTNGTATHGPNDTSDSPNGTTNSPNSVPPSSTNDIPTIPSTTTTTKETDSALTTSTTSLGQGDPQQQQQQQLSSGAPSTTGASSTVYGQSAV